MIVLLNNWCEIQQYQVNYCIIITYNIVYRVCDEEIDNFCCRFTTISLVMERNGGCRIASPAWQTNSLVARQQYSQATVNKVLPLVTDSPAFLTISDHLRFANFYHQCHHTSTGLGVRWDAHFFRRLPIAVTTKDPQIVFLQYYLSHIHDMMLAKYVFCNIQQVVMFE